MAIPLSIPVQGHRCGNFWSKNHITTPNLGLLRRGDNTRMLSGMTARNDSTLTVSEPEREKKKEYEEGRESITKMPKRKLADSWKEIHGQDDWAGMLDPMEPLLRSELIRYGEMAQACYDAFDSNPHSKYCGSCKVEPSKFFQSLGLSHFGYEVTRYLHASYNTKLQFLFKKSLWPDGWNPTANWIGYVAVSDDETSAHLGRRDIGICWRGSVTGVEWVEDFKGYLRSVGAHKIPSPDPKIKAEAGFLHVYTDKEINSQYCKYSAREQVLAEVKRLVQKYADEKLSITITGHSLGSALAILNAYDIAETWAEKVDGRRVVPICVYSFAGPRVGNSRFKEQLERRRVKVLRVVNVHDKVPKVPGLVFNEKGPLVLQKIGEMSPWAPWCYSHVGVELALDHKNSPFLKETSNPACFHNLEALLHLLDGYRGKGERFVPTGGRDLALVNKRCDFLEDDLRIPPKWWGRTENCLLVKDPMGYWKPPKRLDLEEHLQLEDIHHHLEQLGLASSD